MDNTKTISIVISSFHYGHLAGHCIDSVISQNRKPDKIYFVDDGVGDCKHLNRNFIGIELDEGYFNISKERIEKER